MRIRQLHVALTTVALRDVKLTMSEHIYHKKDLEMNVLEVSGTTMKSFGIAAVADIIASDADQQLFIFRKFNNLAARNLLDMQNELQFLENRQEELDREVELSGDENLCKAVSNYDEFKENLKSHHGLQERRRLKEQIEQQMHKYRMPLEHVIRRRVSLTHNRQCTFARVSADQSRATIVSCANNISGGSIWCT